ncbi:hypothetical protein GGR52DRAFT_156104 [Hypoxylon sp. FL1284]|nr:hypothetical protein GGR52DRAFT_156104 [Hypoxylon sp. FL1284]
MPPKKAAANSADNASDTPNSTDFRILDAVLKACTLADKPKSIDFDLIAKQIGLKNSASAKERWRQICKKYKWYAASDPNTAASSAGEMAPAAAAKLNVITRKTMREEEKENGASTGRPREEGTCWDFETLGEFI